MDIDVVRVGQSAQIRLTAYNQRHRSPLVGEVTRVSADRLTDAKTGVVFYQARVRLPKDMATKFPELIITLKIPAGGLQLVDVERELIRQALERSEGNRTHAAELLGLTRDTLRYRIEKFDLS